MPHPNDPHDPRAPHDPPKPGAAEAPVGPLRLAANYTEGGHEIDYTPNKNLMAFLAVMAILLVLSSLGVYQLFVAHSEAQLEDAAAVPASQLIEQKQRDEALRTSYGQVELEGKVVGLRVPFAEAKRMVLADPARFAAAAAPEGWIHPDDAGKK